MTEPTKLNRHASSALVAELRERNSTLSKAEAELAIGRVFDGLVSLIDRTEGVRIHNFGTFKKKFKPARQGRNPQTGGTVSIPARNVVTFKQAKAS